MNQVVQAPSSDDIYREVSGHLETLRRGFEANRNPSLKQRVRWLDRLRTEVIRRQDDMAAAVNEDYGSRSRHEALIAEVFVVANSIKYMKSRLGKWMKPQSRHIELTFKPAKGKVHFQPKGVVGILSPWNYPYQLSLVPLATALAAGNRALIKPSELTPKCSQLMAEMLHDIFDESEVRVVTGGVEYGAAISNLPLDHLIYTGSTRVGRIVMEAAAKNLTPVTLELGGKSPTIVHKDFPVNKAAERIVMGKLFNAGQTCIAPDYVFVHEHNVDAFVSAAKAQVAKTYPTLVNNPDYTSIVNERHRARLESYIEDAQQKGAHIVELNPANESFEGAGNKLMPRLVLDVTEDMDLMNEEIFGPLLPVLTYRDVEETVRFVNARPRPLALYYFDYDKKRAQNVLENTISGGACINECLFHVVQDDLPFGGVGDSGIGAYHGPEGFETLSHKRSVFYQPRLNAASLLNPPHGGRIEKMLKLLIGRG